MQDITMFTGRHLFLDNEYPCLIADEYGIVYPSLEHAYQCQKTSNPRERRRLLLLPSPRLAVTVDRPRWQSLRQPTMAALLAQKFGQPPLQTLLRRTGDSRLVAGNYWHDGYWGACRCGTCPPGENRLGELLMAERGVSKKAPLEYGKERVERRGKAHTPHAERSVHAVPRDLSLSQ